jgi:hypothetical protein
MVLLERRVIWGCDQGPRDHVLHDAMETLEVRKGRMNEQTEALTDKRNQVGRRKKTLHS